MHRCYFSAWRICRRRQIRLASNSAAGVIPAGDVLFLEQAFLLFARYVAIGILRTRRIALGSLSRIRTRLRLSVQPTRQNLCRGDDGDLVAHRELTRAVVNDVTPMNDIIVDTFLQMLPVVCIGGDTGLELETHAMAAAIAQKVDFGAGVSAKKIKCAPGALQLFERGDLLNHESFETVATRGRGQQLIRGTDSEQVMKDAAIAQIDLWCLHEPLFHVRVIGLAPAYKKVSYEEIEDALYRVI